MTALEELILPENTLSGLSWSEYLEIVVLPQYQEIISLLAAIDADGKEAVAYTGGDLWEYKDLLSIINTGESIYKYDTGGYTGSWGPEGRLALLHQKEIVLDADDTKNLLSAVDLVRTIASTIDLQAQSQALALNMRAAMIVPQSQTLEQQVTIHAEFPNATNHSEIEQAFDTLINRATQYTNRL